MNQFHYSYLFPYEKVRAHSRIVIYGAGVMGQEYLKQMRISNYCQVIALADRDYEAYQNGSIPVCAPSAIHTCDFDYVVIALRGETYLQEMRRVLLEQGVPDDRIVHQAQRDPVPDLIGQSPDPIQLTNSCPAYTYVREGGQPVAVNIFGGVGDAIIQKKTLESLTQLFSNAIIDIYAENGVSFLRFLYKDMKQVNWIGHNCGTVYDSRKEKYALAITVRGTVRLYVDWIKAESFPVRFARWMEEWRKTNTRTELYLSVPLYPLLGRSLYRGHNCYDRLHFDNQLPRISDQVAIPIDDNIAYGRFKELRLGRYVSINYGNGSSKDISTVAKSWPKENFEKLIAMLHDRIPSIKVVQIGSGDLDKLHGADQCFLGEGWEMVAQLLKYSLLHIDIEGGLVHFATQLGTKCVVLFGPTPIRYYGYRQNINIQAGDCHGCLGLYLDVNRCAKGMERPACMYCITPSMVMKRIDEVLGSTDA